MPWYHIMTESGRVVDQVERLGDDDAGEWASKYWEVEKVSNGIVFIPNQSEDYAAGRVFCSTCGGLRVFTKTFPPADASADELEEGYEKWECNGCGETAELEVRE